MTEPAPESAAPESPRPLPAGDHSRYSLVAWPPEALDTWMRRAQAGLNVRGFGLPHLNIRAPFHTDLGPAELVAACRAALQDQPAFSVRVLGWKRVPSMFFLECELSEPLRDLHERILAVGPSSRARHDGAEYRPHLTLALGVLPWAEDLLWAQVQALVPPVDHFEVEALSLTREWRGEVQELHTFPLRPVGQEGLILPAPEAAPS
ncbi:2'-5' RNA ligase family protein [Deinococcus multiflagellatus]|uniref:2'-5' RNA ligase family protein n=1 Tax=Deinococcus multiflagellatus TaxID=1656887 RepID=A0ABW1ZN23_9DEIO|nr:2'-5' RNA ligase family protein [Deinococcus multiflagellatus]